MLTSAHTEKSLQSPSSDEWTEFILNSVEHCLLTKELALEMVGHEGDSLEVRQKKLRRFVTAFKLRTVDFEVIEKYLTEQTSATMSEYRESLKRYLTSESAEDCLHSSMFFFKQLHQWSMRWCRS